MSNIQSYILGAGLFFLVIFATGFWVSRAGKPYPAIKLNVHKLISLGAVVFLVITINKIHKVASLSSLQILVSVVSALLFLVTIVLGGLSSIEKNIPEIFRKFHHISPYLTLISCAILFCLLYE